MYTIVNKCKVLLSTNRFADVRNDKHKIFNISIQFLTLYIINEYRQNIKRI